MGIPLSQAAKLVGKSRKTLYRHAGEGRISTSINTDGVKEVEPSELERVYGKLVGEHLSLTQSQNDAVSHAETGEGDGRRDGEVEALKGHIQALEANIANLKDSLAQSRVDLMHERRRVDRLTDTLATSGRMIESHTETGEVDGMFSKLKKGGSKKGKKGKKGKSKKK